MKAFVVPTVEPGIACAFFNFQSFLDVYTTLDFRHRTDDNDDGVFIVICIGVRMLKMFDPACTFDCGTPAVISIRTKATHRLPG